MIKIKMKTKMSNGMHKKTKGKGNIKSKENEV